MVPRNKPKRAVPIIDPLVESIMTAVRELNSEFTIILSQVQEMSRSSVVTDKQLNEVHRSAKRCVVTIDELVRITTAP